MTRLTIDYGIDLGTTNSAIAVREDSGVVLIPNKDGSVTTPSAVHVDKRGRIFVGAGAKNELLRQSENNTATVFKRTMGQGAGAAFQFESSGRKMLPEELSAEVLKELRADVRDKRGEELREIVITVPADFDTGQCAATKDAARLAGFSKCTLLLEPIAAALAYGLQKLETEAYWLIYDFGGGTFDAAVIQIEDGVPRVVNHAGNNYLGGVNIDRDLVTRKLVPVLTDVYHSPPFDPQSNFWRIPRARLQAEVEKAKIQVCRSARPAKVLLDELCADRSGKMIDFEAEITPEDVVEVTAPYVAQTLDLCRRALAEKGLKPAQMDKIIMVGGSTLSPWVRKEVQSEFNRPTEISIDPMTVVALGAAVLASTITREQIDDDVPAGSYNLEIKSPLVADEPRVEFSAIVKPPEGGQLAGLTIEFIDETTGWRSGKIRVGSDARVRAELRVTEGKGALFQVQLRTADGTLAPCAPDRVALRWGIVDVEIPLTANIGVGMANGRLDAILERGTPLPTKKRSVHYIVNPLRRGPDSVLHIPLYDGPNVERAIRNRLLIDLRVEGKDLPRDVPAGKDIEITLHCDRSRTVTATAYIPDVEKEVTVTVDLEKTVPSAKDTRLGLQAQKVRLERLRKDANRAGDAQMAAILTQIDAEQLARRIEQCLQHESDAEQLGQAERSLRDFASQIDQLEDLLEWPRHLDKAKQLLEECRRVVGRAGAAEHWRDLEMLEKRLEELAVSREIVRLHSWEDETRRLLFSARDADPGWWIGYFEYLRSQAATMSDRKVAEMLVNRGEGAKNSQPFDFEALKAICRQLTNLLPDTPPPPPPAEGKPGGGTQKH
jgi:molecular chaperone DnaK